MTVDNASGIWGLWLQPIVLVGLGSALGGNLRYWLGRWVETQQWPGGLPWGTIWVNLTGSLLLGFLAVWLLERLGPEWRGWYLFLGTGLCGGYTTFSTFEWETLQLIRQGSWPLAVLNVAVSVLGGLLALGCGALLAVWLLPRR